jgi:hypothetical protein
VPQAVIIAANAALFDACNSTHARSDATSQQLLGDES